jgi:hypothetical protein
MLTKNVLGSDPRNGVLPEPFWIGGAPVHVKLAMLSFLIVA